MATKNIEDAVKEIRDKWDEIKNEYFKRMPGKYLVLSCVHRSPDEQLELFKKGRTLGTDGKWYVSNKAAIVTNVDGYKILGAHNYKPARAIDVAVVDNQTGKYLWEEKYYFPLLQIAQGVGLESGLEWKTFKDGPHIQVKGYKTYQGAV